MKIAFFRTTLIALALASVGCAHRRVPPEVIDPQALVYTSTSYPDGDWDGVRDQDDRCPDVAGPASNGGCPAISAGDSDGDGVPDSDDHCPHEAGVARNQGCAMRDCDHDGIKDKVDECPYNPGPKSTNGCPDEDRDGVADKDDYCPKKEGRAENHGCPLYDGVTVTKNKLETADKIYFADNQSTILARSLPLLDQVAKVLGENRNIRLRIEVYTDNSGDAKHDLALSEARANAVRAYLCEKQDYPATFACGVAAMGLGSTAPLADNETAEGREKNRRVDFVITYL